jgi:hypothetical protein
MLVSRLATYALVAVALAVGAPRARACDTEENARPTSTCVALKFRGVGGTWFRLAEGQALLTSVKLGVQLTLQLETYRQMEVARAGEVAALRGALDAERAANAKLTAAVVASEKEASAATADATQAREELGRWWRSPIVWLAVGAAAGALAGIAIAH